MELEISVISDRSADDLASLGQWLRRERDLAGGITMVRNPPSEGELGSALDLLTAAIGSGGTFAVLAMSLEAWLRNRPRAKIKVTRGESTIEIDAGNARDLRKLMKEFGEPEAGPAGE